MQSNETIELALDKGAWIFKDNKDLNLRGDGFEFSLALNHNNPPENLNVAASGTINLEILKKLVPQIETAQGQIDFNAKVTGSIEDPQVNIKIRDRKLDPFERRTWKPISIGLIDLSPAITNILVDVDIKNNLLLINRISGAKGKGNIKIKGKVDLLDPSRDASLVQVELDRIELQRIRIPVFKGRQRHSKRRYQSLWFSSAVSSKRQYPGG